MLETQVKNTLKKIKLSKKDKILVALSGGKDSTVTAYLLNKFGYNISGVHIDLKMGKYSKDCLDATKKLCEDLGIKLYVYDVKKEMGSSMCYIRSAVQTKHKGTIKNCAICGVIKKWILNKEARKLKFDKIATGHNLDDEAQTVLMNVFKGSLQLSASSGPITKNTKDKKFISRIKPLFYVLEDDVRVYAKKKKLPVHYDKCPCAIDSYRIQVRNFLEKLPGRDKKNIMKNFEKIKDKIKKNDLKINYCGICGEPSRGKVCKKCSLMKL
jgi:uncharacterized protein (TIGR00269 family)